MARRGRPRRGYALIALIVLIFLAGCVDYPPAWSVCLTCEQGLEEAATDGPNVSVTHSELAIHVREDGTGRWTVRSELTGPGVESLRADTALVERFAAEAVTDSVGDLAVTYAIHDGDVHDLSARMDGDAVVISFVVEDMARPGFDGVLLVDYFNTRGGKPAQYGLGADRMVIRGPPETVITNRPPRATVSTDGKTAVWEDRRAVSGDTYLAFGPDGTTSTRLATRATVARAVVEWVVPGVARLGLFYSVVMTVVAVVLVEFASERASAWISDPAGALRTLDVQAPPIEFIVVPLSLLGVAVAAVVDLGGSGHRLVRELVTYPPIVPVALFFLLGHFIDHDRRITRSLVMAIGGWPIVAAAAVVVELPHGSGYRSLGPLEIGVGVLVTLVVGIPLFFLARRLSPTE